MSDYEVDGFVVGNARTNWTMMKAKNETPCCHQSVRVKIVEPGVQTRKCDLCKTVNHFTLEPSQMFPDRLRLRWLTDSEVEQINDPGGELGIEDL